MFFEQRQSYCSYCCSGTISVTLHAMNSDFRNCALESRLLGHWTCASERESCEYTFLANNEFTCIVSRSGESSFKIRGYWDVVGENLRIGTSPLTNEPAHIQRIDGNSFSAELPSRTVMRFERRSS
jgi:hypothetical protein